MKDCLILIWKRRNFDWALGLTVRHDLRMVGIGGSIPPESTVIFNFIKF